MSETTIVGDDQVEVANYGVDKWIALIVWPRGFANEFRVYGCRADDDHGRETLRLKVQRRKDVEPGDGYDCQWMTRIEFIQHLHEGRDAQGWTYIVTPDGGVVKC